MQQRSYRQVPNFNFIPPEYLKRPVSYRRYLLQTALIALVLVEVFFIWGVRQDGAALQSGIDSARQQVRGVEEQMAKVNADKEEAKKLQSALDELEKERAALAKAQSELGIGQGPDWPGILAVLLQAKPAGIELVSVKNNDYRVDVTGTAPDLATLLKYRQLLLDSAAVSRLIMLRSSAGANSLSFSLAFEAAIKERSR
ncbi:MAG: hypothetical protein HYX91_04765 [Chloroflexi bacterium]|nr:hypothetical protein [Chloroflexota bacterium]